MLIIKGIIIGIGKIIPGVSGGMLAISLGIYDELIYRLNNILTDFKNNFKFLLKVFIGIFISILLLSKVIVYLLDNYYSITIFFIVGLILGSLNDISRNINNEKKIIVVITFIFTLILTITSINNKFYTDNKLFNFLFYMFSGFIDAITMVVPGVSGTATLMMLGVYDILIEKIANIFDFNSLIFLLPFFVGLLFGIVFSVKLVDYLLKKHKSIMYSIIKGFSFSTIIFMLLKSLNSLTDLLNLILSILVFILGFIVTKKINYHSIN